MDIYVIEYWAWPKGARIKTRGRFEIAAESRDDAVDACRTRWPEMNITMCTLKSKLVRWAHFNQPEGKQTPSDRKDGDEE